MINGLGILGWGVGGIEAEAVDAWTTDLPCSIPNVVGVKLSGTAFREGTTATDLSC